MRRFGVVVALGLVVFGAIKGVGALTAAKRLPARSPRRLDRWGCRYRRPGGRRRRQRRRQRQRRPRHAAADGTRRDRSADGGQPGRGADRRRQRRRHVRPVPRAAPRRDGVVDVELDYIVSSGLARPDFHDWPAHLRDTLATSDPDIVDRHVRRQRRPGPHRAVPERVGVVQTERCRRSGDRRQRRRVDRRVRQPGQRDDGHHARGRRAAGDLGRHPERRRRRRSPPGCRSRTKPSARPCSDYPNAVFVDTWELFDGRNGGIAELVVDPRDGEPSRCVSATASTSTTTAPRSWRSTSPTEVEADPRRTWAPTSDPAPGLCEACKPAEVLHACTELGALGGGGRRRRAVGRQLDGAASSPAQGPVIANVMPGSWRLTNRVWPSAENVAPVNSLSSRAFLAKIAGSPSALTV